MSIVNAWKIGLSGSGLFVCSLALNAAEKYHQSEYYSFSLRSPPGGKFFISPFRVPPT
jgi:hypothetical protein